MKTHDEKVTAKKAAVYATKDPIFLKWGPPFLVDDKMKVTLNERAIAVKCAFVHKIKYCSPTKSFERYDEKLGLWQVEHQERVMQLLDALLVQLGEEFDQVNCVQQIRPTKLQSLHRMLQLFPVEVKSEKVEGLVHVTNGILDLRGAKPKLIKHDPKYRFCFGSGVKFDGKAKCPKFLKKLLESALPKDDILLLQKYFGSMLLGPNESQCILIIRGTAGGGKGTLVTVMEKVLGEQCVADLRAKHLNNRFETSAFLGKRVLIGKDIPGDTLQERGARMLKSLVGDDLMQAEIKYNPTKQSIRGDYHVVLVSNNRLRIALDGDEDAWARRLVVVDYEMAKTTKPIPRFAKQLHQEEGSGILNWLVDGAMAFKADMKGPGKLVLTNVQIKRVEKLLHDSDSVHSFIEQRVVEDEESDVSSEELLMDYFALCKTQKWQPVSSHEFQTRMPDLLGFKFEISRRNDIQREGKAVRGYKNIALN